MNWDSFLDNPKWQNMSLTQRPNGRFLFQYIIHDVREHLFVCSQCVKLVAFEDKNISNQFRSNLEQFEFVIGSYFEEIALLVEQWSKQPYDCPEWPNAIDRIGEILAPIPSVQQRIVEASVDVSPEADTLMTSAIKNLESMNKIRQAIQDREYEYLWTRLPDE